jgi:hypothetical protein
MSTFGCCLLGIAANVLLLLSRRWENREGSCMRTLAGMQFIVIGWQ